jgi:hypothetical protein
MRNNKRRYRPEDIPTSAQFEKEAMKASHLMKVTAAVC